jgi:hypothetical protein
MKTHAEASQVVVNQKNNKIYRIPNHFPMGICISIEFNKYKAS